MNIGAETRASSSRGGSADPTNQQPTTIVQHSRTNRKQVSDHQTRITHAHNHGWTIVLNYQRKETIAETRIPPGLFVLCVCFFVYTLPPPDVTNQPTSPTGRLVSVDSHHHQHNHHPYVLCAHLVRARGCGPSVFPLYPFLCFVLLSHFLCFVVDIKTLTTRQLSLSLSLLKLSFAVDSRRWSNFKSKIRRPLSPTPGCVRNVEDSEASFDSSRLGGGWRGKGAAS